MADAMGCSLLASAVPPMAIILMKEHTESPTNMVTRATRGTPCVTVPVLSNTMHRTWVKEKEGIDELLLFHFQLLTPDMEELGGLTAYQSNS